MSYTAAVITVSDKGFRGEREDTSGPAICSIVERCGLEVVYRSIVPDEQEDICRELIRCADEKKVALVLTTGGTGFSQRDITPEATLAVIERETRGIPEHVLMKHPDRCVRIPMIDEARSLNLANSVAVGCYEVLRQWDYPALQTKGELHRHHWEDTE